jgi:DNA-binding LytR/AlgR family response regulator
VKILICDAPNCVQEDKLQIIDCAKKYGINVTISIVESGEKLLFYQETEYADADLIILGYHLAGQNGYETAQEMRRRGFVGDIVFYSSDASHIGEGYSVDALAYVLKDRFAKENLEKALLKALRHTRLRAEELLTIKHGSERRNIPIRDILYFEVQHRSVTVHFLKDGRVDTFLFNSTLNEMEERLSNDGFLRTHRSYLVSEKHIIDRTFNKVTMVNGDIIPIGRTYSHTAV